MTAARRTRELTPTLIELLGAIGWTTEDDAPLTGVMAGEAVRDTAAVLRRVGELDRAATGWHERPTSVGAMFARAALTTWP